MVLVGIFFEYVCVLFCDYVFVYEEMKKVVNKKK